MKLNDFLYERRNAPRGTYFGVHPTPETTKAMKEFMGDHKIPNPVKEDAMHCTIVFSRVFVSERALGKLDPHWKGKFDKYDLFDPGSKKEDEPEPSKVLVITFNCDDMLDRHKDLKSKGATHDFPTLSPHMSMSYDIGRDYDHSILPGYDGPLNFHEEYSEPLNLNWVKTKNK